MNRVVLVGRLTRDPELRTSGSGNSFAFFTIAVNRQFTSSTGEREADFINCVVYNKQAENLNRYIRKGGLIGVDGRIQTRNYTAPDGTRRFVTEVICDSIQFLEPKSAGQNSNAGSGSEYFDYSPYDMPSAPAKPKAQGYNNNYQGNSPKPSAPKAEPFAEIQNQFDITDDDLPF